MSIYIQHGFLEAENRSCGCVFPWQLRFQALSPSLPLSHKDAKDREPEMELGREDDFGGITQPKNFTRPFIYVLTRLTERKRVYS